MYFKKKNNNYVCEECGLECKQLSNLNRHIGLKHDKISYYEKYVKEEKDGKCVICGKNIKSFNKLSFRNYRQTCSKKCEHKKHSKTINNFSEEHIKKINKKREKTVKEKYGTDNIMKNKNVVNKQRNTMLNRYGVKSATQNEEFMKKSLISRRQLKYFKNTDLWYQGSYELDFLQKYYNKFHIKRGPSFKYKFNGKDKIYHSDFHIPSKNLIVECKSSYTLELDEEINEKKKAVLDSGYKYLMILNKNYKELENA